MFLENDFDRMVRADIARRKRELERSRRRGAIILALCGVWFAVLIGLLIIGV